MKDIWRFHFFKLILGLAIIQFGILAWFQYRNHIPVGNVDEVKVFEGQSAKISPLNNDTDKDEDKLSIQEVADPLHGKITINKNILEYTAKVGFTGVDSFTYLISDGRKESNKVYIKVNVLENFAPEVRNDRAQLYVGSKTMLYVLKNDYDKEGDSIFLKEFTRPQLGTLIQQENKLIYQSNGIAGRDSFQYVVSDGFNESEKATVQIEIKSKNSSCYPWMSEDIGQTAIAGSLGCNKNVLAIQTTGTDLWGTSDRFHYAYRYLKGDGEIYTRIDHIDPTHKWVKVAVMIRESKAANSKYMSVGITPEDGAFLLRRLKTGNSTTPSGGDKDARIPYWVKLVRRGDSFTSYLSKDGIQWKRIESETLPMSENVHIGFAVSNPNNEKRCKVVFSNYHVVGKLSQ